ncbi:MAG: radical SAM protein [Acetobacteraceae bacterium]|nr:radical SAM protein [Acetobacteraceae bacterium]
MVRRRARGAAGPADGVGGAAPPTPAARTAAAAPAAERAPKAGEPPAAGAAGPPEPHPAAEVLVATTWECNLACSYCFVRGQGLGAPGVRMTPGLAARVVDALDEGLAHVESVCLHLYGGEPLTNLPAMRAMVERAGIKRPGRFRFAITTNGVAAGREAFDLLEAGRFQVVLSIDGPAEVHDECRRTPDGRPTHAAVLRFLETLRTRTRCPVRGSAVVRSGWSLAQADAYLRSLPIDLIKAQAVRLPPGSPYALTPAERLQYLADLEEAGRRVIADLEAGRPPRDDRFSSRVLQLLRGGARAAFCGAGVTAFGIAPDGTVLPCVLVDPRRARLGHVAGAPGEWVEAGLRWRSAQRPQPRCLSCSAFPLCGGGCPAVLPVCGDDECELVRKNCEVARAVFERFRAAPHALLALAGVV